MANTSQYQDGPEGIGGWLILPVIGLFLTPVMMVIQLSGFANLSEIVAQLTPAQTALVYIEIAGNVIIGIIVPIILLVLLFNRKRLFPRLYCIWAAANLLFVIADLIAVHQLFGQMFEAAGVEFFDADTIRSIVRAIVLAALWIPYMLMSRRVRNTFVN